MFDLIKSLLDKAFALLQGEPLRVIIYGGAVAFWLVAKVVGAIPDVAFDQAIAQTTVAAAALVALVEMARRLVTPVAG